MANYKMLESNADSDEYLTKAHGVNLHEFKNITFPAFCDEKSICCSDSIENGNFTSPTKVTSKFTMDIKTFVFLDCETTGLPSQENNSTKITELCLTAVQSDHINSGSIPRIQNKLNLFFNPNKVIHPKAAEISQLSNNLLEHQPDFSGKTSSLIRDFLSLLQQPVCFAAHSGDRFDYPILRAELYNTGIELPEEILCIDTYVAIRKLYKEDTKRHKENIRRRAIEMVFSKEEKELAAKEEKGDNASTASAFRNGEVLQEEPLESQIVDEPDGPLPNNIAFDLESSGCMSKFKLSPEKVRKMNETTPKENCTKNMAFSIDEYNKDERQRNGNGEVLKHEFHFEYEKKPSFKLVDLYTTLTSKLPTDAHKAEYDVRMLIECATVLNERFVDWADWNAKRFCDIPRMEPT